MRVVLAAPLAEAGYLVSLASNGFTGLRLARRLLPHVVLLDLVVPEVPGPVVLRELRHHPATCNIPVILMLPTVSAAVPNAVREADGVLRTPVGGRELLAEVHTAATRRRALWTATRGRPAAPPPRFTQSSSDSSRSNTLAPVLVAR